MAALHQVLCPEKRREKTKAARLEAKGTVFQTDKSAQDSDTSCKFGGPQNHSHFLPVGYKFGGPHRLTQACSKVLYLQLQFFFFFNSKRMQIRYKSEPAKGRNTLGRIGDWEGSKQEACIVLRDILPSQHQSVIVPVTIPGISTSFGVQSFYWGFIICIYDWLDHRPLGWTQSLAFSCSLRLDRYHLAQQPHPLITWLVFLCWPAPMLSPLISINFLGPFHESPKM